MTILEKLSASEDSDVRKQSNGALFVLRGDNDVTNSKYNDVTNSKYKDVK